jgi:pyrroline-5-carboxylate reductase
MMARRPAGASEPEAEVTPVAPGPPRSRAKTPAAPAEAAASETPPVPDKDAELSASPPEGSAQAEPPAAPAAKAPRANHPPHQETPVETVMSDAEETHAEETQTRTTPPAAPAATPTTASAGNATPLLREKRIGIIGAGAMGGALCRGLIHAEAAPANRILVSDPHSEHVQNLQKNLGIRVAESNSQVAKYTDVIVLAVKPYNVVPVLDEVRESLHRDGGKPMPLLVSIAAGVPTAKIEAHVPEGIPVVRAMPNTPAQVGQGACAYCRGTHTDDEHMAQAREIFRSVGSAIEVPEALMDAVTALSGSGPAYVYLMIEALVDGGVKVGLPREVAHELAAQTVLGAAQMVIETGMHPAQLRDMVTTPAGTTIVALAALEQSGLRAALIDAVERAAARSRELA